MHFDPKPDPDDLRPLGWPELVSEIEQLAGRYVDLRICSCPERKLLGAYAGELEPISRSGGRLRLEIDRAIVVIAEDSTLTATSRTEDFGAAGPRIIVEVVRESTLIEVEASARKLDQATNH